MTSTYHGDRWERPEDPPRPKSVQWAIPGMRVVVVDMVVVDMVFLLVVGGSPVRGPEPSIGAGGYALQVGECGAVQPPLRVSCLVVGNQLLFHAVSVMAHQEGFDLWQKRAVTALLDVILDEVGQLL